MRKLRARDAAQLLVDKVPTRFTKKELGLPSDCTREHILSTLENHEVLKAADGHPGTLVRSPLMFFFVLEGKHNISNMERTPQIYVFFVLVAYFFWI